MNESGGERENERERFLKGGKGGNGPAEWEWAIWPDFLL